MTILGGLLPGLRDIRGPLAAGLGWAIFLLVLLLPHQSTIEHEFPEIHAVRLWVSAVLGTYAIAALPVLIYVLGIVSHYLVGAVGRVLLIPLRAAVHAARRHARSGKWDWRSYWFNRSVIIRRQLSATSPEAVNRAQLVQSRILPPEFDAEFPVVAVLADARATELRLSHEHPDQFQVVDRLQAESEFRLSLGAPIVAVAGFFAVNQHLAALALLVPGIVMLWQGLRHRRMATDTLWTASYLGYADPPILTAAAQDFQEFVTMQPGELDVIDVRSRVDDFLSRSGVDYRILSDFRHRHEPSNL